MGQVQPALEITSVWAVLPEPVLLLDPFGTFVLPRASEALLYTSSVVGAFGRVT